MKHFVLLLYAGDYRDAFQRREQGLRDRYRHHSYALETLDSLRAKGHGVTVVQVNSPTTYSVEPAEGMRFVGLGGRPDAASEIAALLSHERASHVMLRYVSSSVLKKLVELPLRVSVVLADSFPNRWRRSYAYGRFGRLLRHPRVDFVSNHQLNSSQQLVSALGVPPERVIPWDWPLDLVDEARRAPKVRARTDQISMFYAGGISEAKGVGDLVRSLAILKRQGIDANVALAGPGELAWVNALAIRLGVRSEVSALGRVECDRVFDLMSKADLVCVPSRWGYPEGLPLTIYEAMASGTPLLASDHPMFAGVVRNGETGLTFRAEDPRDLARAVRQVWFDRDLYAHLSLQAAEAYPSMGLSPLWGELLTRWVLSEPDELGWLVKESLTARGYHNQ